jgi:2-dehydro-3-deoxyphosphogluconate aldolase/(4S)-4-hydroxy-2-oxoglutarate aldolase
MREQIIQKVEQEKIIAILRGADPEQCVKVAQALYDGGIRLMEITYNQKDPSSWQTTADTIAAIAKEFEGRLLVGAGTVTCPELVDITAKAGGLYIISPDCNEAVIRRTRELGLVSMPGALTPTDVTTAWDAGADIIKLFPISCLGPAYLKAIKAPLSHIPMMAVGGITEKNAADYLAAGAIGVGVGGNLANKTWIDAGEYHKITETAAAMVAAVK